MLLVRVLPSVAFVAAMLCAATLAADAAETAKQTAQIDLTQWPLGDIASVRDDPFGVLVKYGLHAFLRHGQPDRPNGGRPGEAFCG